MKISLSNKFTELFDSKTMIKKKNIRDSIDKYFIRGNQEWEGGCGEEHVIYLICLTNEIIITCWALYVRYSKWIILLLSVPQNKISKDKQTDLENVHNLLKITEIIRAYHGGQACPLLMHCDLKPNKDPLCSYKYIQASPLWDTTLPCRVPNSGLVMFYLDSSQQPLWNILFNLTSSHSGNLLKDLHWFWGYSNNSKSFKQRGWGKVL